MPETVMVPLITFVPLCVMSAEIGEKTTEKVHVPPAPSVVPVQVSPVTAKLASEKPILFTVVEVPDWFVIITGHALEVEPTETDGVKFRKGQLKVSELDTAVPLIVIVLE